MWYESKLQGNLEEFLSCGDMKELITCMTELAARVDPNAATPGRGRVGTPLEPSKARQDARVPRR